MGVSLIVVIVLGLVVFLFFLFKVIEPTYMLFFRRPLFLHWYPFAHQLDVNRRQILTNEFPFYNRLSARRKKYFEFRISAFLSKYEFVGIDIELTEQMKILVAATYVMLTFGMRNYLVNLFDKIVLYNSSYYSTSNKSYHKGEFNPKMKAIVFSWHDFLLGHSLDNDNINLGLHEFTHALYFHCLKSNDASAIIFFDEFKKIVRYYEKAELKILLKEKGYLRLYAFENKFEFLSVILEHFFETPKLFKAAHPDLYSYVLAMINYDENDLQ